METAVNKTKKYAVAVKRSGRHVKKVMEDRVNTLTSRILKSNDGLLDSKELEQIFVGYLKEDVTLQGRVQSTLTKLFEKKNDSERTLVPWLEDIKNSMEKSEESKH